MVRIFMKCTRNNLLTLYQLIELDFPSWADKIVEPCPDMNIKVAAFTVIQKAL